MSAVGISATEGVVARTFSMLETLSAAPEPMRLSALALKLGLRKSTVHRLLAGLIGLGYVEQNPETGCYAATLRLWEFGTRVIAEHPIKRAAAGFLQSLHRATGETVSLTILSGDDVLYLDKIISPRPIRFTTRIGSRVPAPLTAGGKAMLAHASDGEAILRRVAVARRAAGHSLDVETIAVEIEDTRERGYAVSTHSPGVISFAAPVMGRAGQAVAALSVSAPKARVGDKARGEIIDQVLSASAGLAEQVGRL
jgi:DNA-binding IclR family transcriptional regulator